MLAHPGEPADLGSDLLKLSEMPIMMSTSPVDPFHSDPVYHPQNGYLHDPHHIQAAPQQYYQHYDQQYHQFHPPAPPGGGQHPHQHHQHLEQHQEYYHPHQHQQQQMYQQGGYHYQPSHMEQYGGYYQHQHGSYQFQSGQNVMVNSGPSSHGSQNCTPSPHANSDDSGGDCVNEPKLLQLGVSGQYSAPPGVQPVQAYSNDMPAGHGSLALPSKAALTSSVMSRSVTAARRGKKSKHRDPNEPQKPVSAYALFFRDMQAGIKVRNPNSSFGEVSKHVASMWDGLDPDHKAIYKRRTETAKKEYLKRLAAYRASLVSKGGSSDPGSESFGGVPRFPGNFAESGSPVPMTDRKDLGRDFGSPSSSSPPSLLPPNIGSPTRGSQQQPGLSTGERSPTSINNNFNMISSAPPAYSSTTTTTAATAATTFPQSRDSSLTSTATHWQSQSNRGPTMMMTSQQQQPSSQHLQPSQQQQQQQRPQFS